MASLLDRTYAAWSNRRLFFRQGWGNLALLEEALREDGDSGPVSPVNPAWGNTREEGEALLKEGSFPSPFLHPALPAESRTAWVELVLPRDWSRRTPVCLHFAATGDEGFERRRKALALPLIRSGIGSLILENPYYGRRRPPGQHGKMLNVFSDLWLMAGATIAEGRSLVDWLRREGFERLGVCGISMGGSMAARTAALDSDPLAVTALITPHSASAVFTEGLLKNYCAWDVLNRQLDGHGDAMERMREILDHTDIRRLQPLRRPEAAFLVGAQADAYISRESVENVHRHWPGSTLTWVPSGHVGAFLFHRDLWVEAVRKSFARL
ncbi:MAG: alpha/beta hydrolase family protein [Syntrophales bacterium]